MVAARLRPHKRVQTEMHSAHNVVSSNAYPHPIRKKRQMAGGTSDPGHYCVGKPKYNNNEIATTTTEWPHHIFEDLI